MLDFDNNGKVIVPRENKDIKARWSLYKNTSESDYESTNSSILDSYEVKGEQLDPLKFTNGKTQEDVVKEVMRAVDEGHKIIFVHGVCGSGKSAMALNLAKYFKKTAIVVPIRSLQDQYEKDYTKEKFILKEDNTKLKISVIKGRRNFLCKFCDNDCTADNNQLPCSVELREKNMGQIIDYIKQNPDVKKEDFSNISDVRRISVAAACPYWSPLMRAETGGKTLGKARKRKYNTVGGTEYALFERARGCGYYQQYHSYIDSDVLIFNSQKYLLETAMKRKPKTDLDIIDECDDFLDSFANEKKINLSRLISALDSLVPESKGDKKTINEMAHLANKIIALNYEEIEKLKSNKFKELFELILENPYLAENEEGNYFNSVFEAVKSFEDLVSETYVAYERINKEQQSLFGQNFGETVYVNLVSINVSKRFKEIIDSNNVLVLMSGTLHSEHILKEVFGLDNFKVIEAEAASPGEIKKYRTGLEKNCKFENFKNGICTRGDYLKALSVAISNATEPTLVHVSAFSDLPSETEKREIGFSNIPSREEFVKMQENSRNVEEFKAGKTKILFTTKCSRGIDFPGDQCKSIIITRYPYPNIQGLFWQILRKEQPDKFREFYMDKAYRDLVQKIARGVRFKGDSVFLLSPDSRVLDGRVE